MKGESGARKGARGELSTADAEQISLKLLASIVSDPDRLGRFLALTGLDPATIRTAARDRGFLPAVIDHVAGDETLLLALAAELGLPPERLVKAQAVLSPAADWTP